MTPELAIAILNLGMKYGPGIVESIRNAFAAKGKAAVVADIDALLVIINELTGLDQAEAEAGVKKNPDGSVTGGQV